MASLEQVSERVWRLELGRVNAYLVEDDELTLVDAGMPGDAEDVVSLLTEAGHDVVDVDRVLVTHYDMDHVGGLSKLTPGLDAPVYIAEPDASMLVGDRKPPWRNHKGFFQRLTRFLLSAPDLPVERVEEGDQIGTFTAYHTPGHTPGHVCYVSEPRDTVVLGDLVREDDGRLERSPWFISYDTDAVQSSIEKLASRIPQIAAGCMGHGDPLQSGTTDELVRLAREE